MIFRRDLGRVWQKLIDTVSYRAKTLSFDEGRSRGMITPDGTFTRERRGAPNTFRARMGPSIGVDHDRLPRHGRDHRHVPVLARGVQLDAPVTLSHVTEDPPWEVVDQAGGSQALLSPMPDSVRRRRAMLSPGRDRPSR